MSLVATCPSEETLRDFLLGTLTDVATADATEQHLLTCPACLLSARKLNESEDDILAALRAAELPAPQVKLPSVQQLLSGSEHPAAPRTVASGIDDTNEPVPSEVAMLAGFRSLWEPAQEKDELGRLGSYRILRLLGQGGMGAVFVAEDITLKRQVALKLLHPRFASDTDAAIRFQREAQAAAAVRNDHVVAIFQVGKVREIPFISQELLEGETLQDRCRRESRLPLDEALRIASEVALGLAAAHGKGLLHRDIKPSNLWLEAGTGRVKILDFGLAKPLEGDANLTQTDAIVGTPAYMAPEQARGRTVTSQTDLFSLGVVLYELLTGSPPFRAADKMSTILEVINSTPPPVHQLDPAIPLEVSKYVELLLQKSPEGRPATAKEVAAELQRLRNDCRSSVVAAATRRRATSGWGGGVAIGLALLACLFGGWWLWGVIVEIRDRNGKVVAVQTVPEGGEVRIVPDTDRKPPAAPPPIDSIAPPKSNSPQWRDPLLETSVRPRPKLPAPLYAGALTQAPAPISGLESWTLETSAHRTPIVLGGMSFGPRGEELAVGTSSGLVYFYRPGEAKAHRVLATHEGLSALDWSSASGLLATAGSDNLVRVWSPVEGELIWEGKVEKPQRLAWSRDGSRLAIVANSSLQLWSRESEKLTTPQWPGNIQAISWSPDGLRLAMVREARSLEVRDLAESKLQQSILVIPNSANSNNVTVAWSPKDDNLIAVRFDKLVAICSSLEMDPQHRVELQSDQPGGGLCWSGSGDAVAFGDFVVPGCYLRTYSSRGEKIRDYRDASQSGPAAIVWSPDDRHLALAMNNGRLLWFEQGKSEAKAKVPAIPRGARDQWQSLSPDGGALLGVVKSGDVDWGHARLRIWDLVSAEPKSLAHSPELERAAWSGRGRHVALLASNQITLLDVTDGTNSKHAGNPRAFAWSADDRLLGMGTSTSLEVLDFLTGSRRVAPAVASCVLLAWSADKQSLAGVTERGDVVVWNLKEDRAATVHHGQGFPTTIAWSAKGKLVAGGNQLIIWDRDTQQVLRSISIGPPNTTCVAVAWDEQEDSLVTLRTDGARRRWRMNRVDAEEPPSWIMSARARQYLSADRRLAYAADSQDNPPTVFFFEPDTGAPRGVVLNLREEEWAAIRPDGHYRGSPQAKDQLIYLVKSEHGRQRTLTPDEFAKQYGWQNNSASFAISAGPIPATKDSAKQTATEK